MAKTTEEGFIVENNIIKTPDTGFTPDPRGLGFEIYGAMKHFKDKVAEYVSDTGEAETYGSLLQRCIRAAIKLKSLNVNENDVISICSHNHKDTSVPYIAALFLGAKVACLAPQLSVKDTAYLLNIVKPKVVFASKEGIELINEAVKDEHPEMEIVSFEGYEGYRPFKEFLEEDTNERNFEPHIPESLSEISIIVFSSGTTSMPKGVCLSQHTIMHRAFEIMPTTGTPCRSGFSNFRHEENEKHSVLLCYSSFYWVSASLIMTCAIFSGSARMVCSKFDAEGIWNLIDKYKVTYGFMAPAHIVAICGSEKPNDVDVSSFKYITAAGAPLPSSVIQSFKSQFPNTFIAQAFGCTEMGGATLLFDHRRPKDIQLATMKYQSCGRPMDGIWYKVVDVESNRPLGPNQKGELKMKSPAMCSGYYNSSESPFDVDGWLPTGDLVHYDEDYCFYVTDRLKQMLKFKSWQIAPAMIEEVIAEHPAVKASVVIGLPHPEYGDLITAVVMLKDNCDKVTPRDIQEFVDERVDDNKKLRGGVKFITEFPLTPSGKIRRLEIKQMITSGKL